MKLYPIKRFPIIKTCTSLKVAQKNQAKATQVSTHAKLSLLTKTEQFNVLKCKF